MQDIRYVVFHRPGPGWLAGKAMFEEPGVREHVAHYRKWLEAGKLELGGPHPDSTGGGMMVPIAGVSEDEVALRQRRSRSQERHAGGGGEAMAHWHEQVALRRNPAAGATPNPSLHPKCNSWLRHLLPSGELKR
jgi:hypothetical protein